MNLTNLEAKSADDLRSLCRQLNVKGAKTKEEMVAGIIASQAVRAKASPKAKQAAKPKASSTSKKQIASDVAAGLGAICWFDLSDTAITPTKLRKILADEGEDSVTVPSINAVNAVRTASRSYRKGRGHADRYRADLAYEDDDKIEVGILQRVQVDDHTVEWQQVDACTFAKDSKTFTETAKTAEADEYKALAEKRMKYLDHNFVRPEVIQASLGRMGAFSLRRQGGCYYVPVQNMDALERLQRIVERIGTCTLDFTHVMATDAGRQAISREAQGTLEGEVREVCEQLDRWAESTRRVTSSSEASVLATFGDIRARARLYADALSVTLEGVEAKVAEAETRAREILAGQPEVSEGKISDRVMKRAEDLVDLVKEHKDGTLWVSPKSMMKAGFSEAATRNSGMWGPTKSNVQAMATLGYRCRLFPKVGLQLIPSAQQ